MPLPQLTVHRHNRRKQALITLVDEIDLGSAPLVRTALALILDLTGSGVRLRRVSRWQAQDVSGKLTDPYMDSRETSPPEAYRRSSRQRFLDRLTAGIRRPGFAMVIAETDVLVGCTFGFPVRSDGFWWLGFDGALPRGIGQLTASNGVFVITEIMVRPLVDRADHLALASLRSWGWLDVEEIWKAITATLLRVLVRPVGERTAATLKGLAHDAWTRWPG